MMEIDKSKPILVTGANGYVASWLVKSLLDEGLKVHAAVRNPNNEQKVGHLKALAAASKGELKLFAADLLKEGSYKEAMQACELVYHTASPFKSEVKDPQKELVDPALKGTENVLRSANETESVKRVVVTSSVVAIFSDAQESVDKGVLTEADWNETASLSYQPYAYSKTLAEKKAWEMAEAQNRWDLVCINMSFVLGPFLSQTANDSESITILKMFGDGQLKMGVPNLGMGMVDVRDVAEAHKRAGFRPEAQGRYITSAHNTNFLSIGQSIAKKYGKDYPLPKKALPKWLVMLAGPFLNKSFTRNYVKRNVNVPVNLDNSKIKRELEMDFRPMEETLHDGFQEVIDKGLL